MDYIGNLINIKLQKSINDQIIKQISDSKEEFIFLSSESKESLKEYYNQKNSDLKIAKKLWKDLLIDSVSILKINDSREKIYDDSSKNKNILLEKFSSIRKSNSYGIDEIDKYFDDFIEFESVLYGMDRHYRDHINHVIQVWAIGVGLIYHNNFQLNDGYKVNMDSPFNFDLEEEEKVQTISQSEFFAMWTIIALCHDLGYPIEKTSKINKQAKKIISHFGNMQFTELDYSFSIFNTFLVEKFLNIISSKVFPLAGSRKFADIDQNKKKESVPVQYHTSIQTKYRDKLSKSLEDYKHGIFSSLLLFKNLTYFLETDYFIQDEALSPEDARQFYIRKEILRSIAGHTCPKMYHINLNTLSFLLILCDELQEWNRPKFDGFIYNINEKTPLIYIKEFTINTIQKIRIEMIYDFDIVNNNVSEKYLVIDRFKNIHYLLRGAKEDSIRKIYFEWNINFENVKYCFIFDSQKTSFEQLSVVKESEGNKNEIDLYK